MSENNANPGTQNNGQSKPTLSWSQPAAAKPAANNAKPVIAPAATPVKNATATNGSTSSTGSYVGIFAAGIIIGALVGWGITSGGNKGNVSSTASSTNMMATSTTQAGAQTNGTQGGVDLSGSNVGSNTTLTLAPTQQAGFAVAVTHMSITQPTWLVVYEDHNGTPGNAIGAALFFAGQGSGTIQLLRATLPGQSYYVGQSLDDGDKIFSLTTDKPVRDSKGNPLFTEFTAQ